MRSTGFHVIEVCQVDEEDNQALGAHFHAPHLAVDVHLLKLLHFFIFPYDRLSNLLKKFLFINSREWGADLL